MNKERRELITEIIEKLQNWKEEAARVLEEEQEYFDNMPEGLQVGERGDKAQEAIQNLENAVESLDTAVESLESAKE